jgi:SAM-dependent methyltransferase
MTAATQICVACGGPVSVPVRDGLRDYEYGSAWTGAIRGCAACGLEVIEGTFPHPAVAPGSADFVQINHVIEHDPDPVALLDHIWDALKPGGWVVGETENIGCLSYRLFGRYWSLLHMPYHLLFFTPDTLRDVFARSRFGAVQVQSQADAPAWSLSIQNWLRRRQPPGAGVTQRIPGFLLLSVACVPLSWLEAGNGPILRFVAQKPAAR